jgi:hypothetical protein
MGFGGYNYERIQALSDIDFDALARSSLPFLEPNAYPWEGHEVTDDDRVETLRKRVLKVYENPIRKKRGGENFLFIQKHRGEVMGVNVGYIFGNTYMDVYGYYGPNADGSRSWWADIDFWDTGAEFFRSLGIENWFSAKPRASRVNQRLEDRFGLRPSEDHATIDSEIIHEYMKNSVLQLRR